MRHASHWYEDRRLRYCFQAIKQYARAVKMHRSKLEQQAREQLKLLRSIFQSWKQLLLMFRQQQEKMKRAKKRWDLRLLLSTFLRWRTSLPCRMRARMTAIAFWRGRQRALQRRIFCEWLHITAERVVHIALLSRLHHRWEARLCAKVMQSWRWAALLSLERVGMWGLTARRMRFHLKQRCLQAWYRICVRSRCGHEQAKHILTAWQSRRLRLLFRSWMAAAVRGVQLRQMTIQASSVRVMTLVSRAWDAWQQARLMSKCKKRAMAGAIVRQQNRVVAAAFYMWAHMSKTQQQQHRLLRRMYPLPHDAYSCSST
jgi:hypothetical protein